jgi:hypothetical protein
MAGVPFTLAIPAPAAGADWTFVPSQTDRTLLLAIASTLTTSATAANRRPALELVDQSGLVYWSADAVFPQVASLAVTYSWARGAGAPPAAAEVTGQRIALPLPWARLQPGDTIKSVTAAIAGTDQWSQIVFRGIIGDWWEEESELAHLAEAFTIAATG